MISNLHKILLKYEKISIDSRDINEKDIFLAIKGEKYNGNAYAHEALSKGASYAIIDDITFFNKNDPRLILVDNTVECLKDLATHHRSFFNIPFIAITGSSGKTTTKELIKQLLSLKYKRVFASKGNYNSKIGLPLTLLEIPKDTEIVVLELGASEPKNISELCNICKPTHGLITCIKEVHLEGFKDIYGVLKGKTELFEYLKKNNNTIFLNISDRYLNSVVHEYPNSILYTVNNINKDEYHNLFLNCITQEANGPYLSYQIDDNEVIRTHILGNFSVNNVASALCIAKYFDIDIPECNKKIEKYRSYDNRLEEITMGTNIVILDAYNSNYESLKNSIDIANEYEYKKKVLVIGPMDELYDKKDLYHKKIVLYIKNFIYDEVFFFGDEYLKYKNLLHYAKFISSKEDLKKYFNIESYQNSLILLKASRSYKFETLIKEKQHTSN